LERSIRYISEIASTIKLTGAEGLVSPGKLLAWCKILSFGVDALEIVDIGLEAVDRPPLDRR